MLSAMPVGEGELLEIWLDGTRVAGRLAVPLGLHPSPGQYLLAWTADAPASTPVPAALFPGGGLPLRMEDAQAGLGALAVAGPLPDGWLPGQSLRLRGPLGRGFHPGPARRLALAALGDSPARLLPLIGPALSSGAAVALLCDTPLPPGLPADLEISPLDALAEFLDWADYLAVDLPAGLLDSLRGRLGNGSAPRLGLEAQVLLETAIPCAGLAECGVCAVRTRHGWRLGCKDGPVFNLRDLEW